MSTPDWLVVAWWVLAAAIGIPTPFLVQRWRTLEQKRAVLSYLREGPRGRYPIWRGETPASMQVALAAAIGLLAVGAVVLFYMEYWTRLTLLNSQILMVIIGADLVLLGLSAKAVARVHSDWPRAVTLFMRAAFVLFGITVVAAGGITAIQDIAFPRRVIVGHVDRVDSRWQTRGPPEYVVVIDGKRFVSTFEAFVHIQPARPVLVTVGAGSGVILEAVNSEFLPPDLLIRN